MEGIEPKHLANDNVRMKPPESVAAQVTTAIEQAHFFSKKNFSITPSGIDEHGDVTSALEALDTYAGKLKQLNRFLKPLDHAEAALEPYESRELREKLKRVTTPIEEVYQDVNAELNRLITEILVSVSAGLESYVNERTRFGALSDQPLTDELAAQLAAWDARTDEYGHYASELLEHVANVQFDASHEGLYKDIIEKREQLKKQQKEVRQLLDGKDDPAAGERRAQE